MNIEHQFAQELLSTFGTAIGEIALVPTTGGRFAINLTYVPLTSDETQTTIKLWDRKEDGGFPEAKILKQRVRNYIEPDRDLGHSDTPANVPKIPAPLDIKENCKDCV